jgi:hypothetical protein
LHQAKGKRTFFASGHEWAAVPARCSPSRLCPCRHAKVAYLERSVLGDQDIRWFDVPVERYPMGLGVLHAEAKLDRPPQCMARVKVPASSCEMVCQGYAALRVGGYEFQ